MCQTLLYFKGNPRFWTRLKQRVGTLLMILPFCGMMLYIHYNDNIFTHPCEFVESESGDRCTEGNYRFECPADKKSIFEDINLKQKCVERETFYDKMWSASNISSNHHTHQRSFRTRCSYSNSVLLSYKEDLPQAVSDSLVVPNVVYYVWFGCKRHFSYINYLSFYSTNKFVQPLMIVVLGDCPPEGKWWNKVLDSVPNIYHLYITRPKLIQGHKPLWIEHSADVVRLQILYENGGIYADTDVLFLKKPTKFRSYPATLTSQDDENSVGNGILFTKSRSSFFCLYLEGFRQYSFRADWDTYSTQYPRALSMIYPDMVNIVRNDLLRPNMYEAKEMLFNGHFDWKQHHAVHIWSRIKGTRLPFDFEDVKKNFANCSLGDIIKHVVEK